MSQKTSIISGLWILSLMVLYFGTCAYISIVSAEMESQARWPSHCGHVLKSVHKRSEIKVGKGAVLKSPVDMMETLRAGVKSGGKFKKNRTLCSKNL